MKWFWYVAREDELMCDLDSHILLEIALKRLQRHGSDGPYDLNFRAIFVTPSQNPQHYHMVIRLIMPMSVLHRLTWELYFMSHVYRSCKNFFRALDGTPAPSLLISPAIWPIHEEYKKHKMFWRKPDATCHCKVEDHKDQKKILTCPAHIKLRGEKK